MKIKAELVDQANLTPREGEVLCLICEGEVDKTIARKLAISIKTVNAHIEHLYVKLDVHNASINSRCSVIAKAVVRGMVRLSSTALCVCLMVGAVQLDDQAVRVVRVGSGHVRLKRGLDD